jgi:hypothetical protein
MSEELIQRLARRISPENPEPTADALRRAPELRGDLAWLSGVLSAVDELPLPPVPPEVSASLHGIMAAGRPTPSADDPSFRTEHAVPIHDSRTAGVLVGVRGVHANEGWTIMYTATSADVIVEGNPGANGGTEVSGQILVRTGAAQPFHVAAAGSSDTSTRADGVGEFFLGELTAGDYEFTATCNDFAIQWTLPVERGDDR